MAAPCASVKWFSSTAVKIALASSGVTVSKTLASVANATASTALISGGTAGMVVVVVSTCVVVVVGCMVVVLVPPTGSEVVVSVWIRPSCVFRVVVVGGTDVVVVVGSCVVLVVLVLVVDVDVVVVGRTVVVVGGSVVVVVGARVVLDVVVVLVVVVVELLDVVVGVIASLEKADSGTMDQSWSSPLNCQNNIRHVPPPFSYIHASNFNGSLVGKTTRSE